MNTTTIRPAYVAVLFAYILLVMVAAAGLLVVGLGGGV